jgi:hypothetical protein
MDGRSRISIHQPLEAPVRTILGLAGMLAFLLPWEQAIRPRLGAANPMALPIWAACLIGAGLGVPFLASAVLGLRRTVTLDPATRTLTVSSRGVLRIGRERRHPFSAIRSVSAVVDRCPTWGETWRVEIALDQGRVRLPRSEGEAEARALANGIAAMAA